MTCGSQHLDNYVTPAGMHGVYVVPMHVIDLDALPVLIHGRPVTAIAPHPHDDDSYYLTTEHPEALAFLPDPYIDLRP